MNNSKKKKQVIATLWLDTLPGFIAHAPEGRTVYATQSTATLRPNWLPEPPEGSFWIMLTSRGEDTIYQYAEVVRGVTQVDAFVDRDRVRKLVDERVKAIGKELESAGLKLDRGRWEA